MIGAEATSARLVELHLYPLKSAAGIAVAHARVDVAGLHLDRHWMLVDAEGRFISQRTHPRMALLRTAFSDDALRVTAPGLPPLDLPLALPRDAVAAPPVRVWRTDRYPLDCGDEAAAWASTFLGLSCRVVRAGAPPDRQTVSPEGFVRASFADAEPALLVSRASLDDLNGRLSESLPMNRFRPNLVVDGWSAFGEDAMGTVDIGGVRAWGVRPCPRCVLTTVDQATGTRAEEPLRTLATYRRMESGEVAFGMNVRFFGPGVLHVGAAVTPA